MYKLTEITNGTPLTDDTLIELGFKINDKYFYIVETNNPQLRICNYNNEYHCSIGDNKFGVMFDIIKTIEQLQIIVLAIEGIYLNIDKYINE